MFQLVKLIRNLKTVNPRLIYDHFKMSPYSEGRRNYRTYTREKIGKISRITMGQVNKGTKKLTIGSSILYGVVHEKYVEVSISYYPTIISEIKSKDYKIFYEGVVDVKPEPIVMEFFDILEVYDETFDKSKLQFESWDINTQTGIDELTTILPLFGSDTSAFVENVKKGIDDSQSTQGKTLLDVLDMSAKKGFWISKTAVKENIQKVVNMAPSSVAAQLNNFLNQPYSDASLEEFHMLGQRYAFADWEKPEIPRGTDIDNLQKTANLMRDKNLKKNMETKPGVYFAGSGHIELVKKL
jgi:hypothetical protein